MTLPFKGHGTAGNEDNEGKQYRLELLCFVVFVPFCSKSLSLFLASLQIA